MSSRVLYPALTSGTTVLAVPSDYISRDHLEVLTRAAGQGLTEPVFTGDLLDPDSDYTFLSAGQIKLNTPANGLKDYLVRRKTPVSALVEQAPGVFSSSKINLAVDQALKLAEEVRDELGEAAENIADLIDATVAVSSNFRATLAEGVADFAVGEYFSSAETGSLRVYKRISGSPFYEDQGDGAAPFGLASFNTYRTREPLLVDDYYEAADAGNWALAWGRCLAAARTQGRSVAATPGKAYSLAGPVEIWPGALGQTPNIHMDGNLFTLANVSAGFRYRGLKSGAVANAASGGIYGRCVFDHLSNTGGSGMRSIALENGGGVTIEGAEAVNVARGYHILNFRYMDGGAVSGRFTCRRIKAEGILGYAAMPGSERWYGWTDTCDLTLAVPGDSIANGATTIIATTVATTASYSMPSPATPYYWTNSTGSPVTVPATTTAAALSGAGLTQGAIASPADRYYASGGEVCFARYEGAPVLEDYETMGGYYGVYVSGVSEADLRFLRTSNTVRGVAVEWAAKHVRVFKADILETVSSGVLYGYGCADGSVDFLRWKSAAAQWIGEAVVNIQLSCPRFRLGPAVMECFDGTTTGQYYLKFSVASGDFRVEGPVKIKGDCEKAYVCVESAYNYRISGANAEHYPQSSVYDGGASADMAGGLLSGITLEQTPGTSTRGSALCIMQVKDEVNGEIGFSSDIIIRNFRATGTFYRSFLKLYDEGATALAAGKALVNKIVMEDCEFHSYSVPASAEAKYSLPRKWGHFKRCVNVTNLDDNTERVVPNVATPDLTFGKYWHDTGSTALNGILGGQGTDNTQGYEGRELFIRGNSSRTWTTVSATSGTRDSLRIAGSPLSLSNTERLHLTYSRVQTAWIGGLEGFRKATTVADPAGGATVDTEARTQLGAVIDALQAAGLMA